MLSFSGVTFVLFYFVFDFFAFAEVAALRSIVFRSSRYACAPTPIRSYHCLRPFSLLFLPFFVSLEMSLSPSIFVRLPFSLCMERECVCIVILVILDVRLMDVPVGVTQDFSTFLLRCLP